jgi:hypothetical protein
VCDWRLFVRRDPLDSLRYNACRAVPCCAVPWCAVLCRVAAPYCAVLPCRAVPCRAVLCCAVPFCSLFDYRVRVRLAAQRFNRGLEAALPLVDLSRHASRLALAGALRDARHLLFYATKARCLSVLCWRCCSGCVVRCCSGCVVPAMVCFRCAVMFCAVLFWRAVLYCAVSL